MRTDNTTPEGGDWKSRVSALKREKPAQITMLAAILAGLGALLAWTFALLPSGSDIRGQPVFWLMALPAMVWMGALQSYSAWAIRTLPLALAATPALALAALLVAPGQVDPLAAQQELGTPLTMAIILAATTVLALVGGVALRRSSLPGGARPAQFLPVGSISQASTLSAGARGALAVGSLSLSGTIVNGLFFGIVAVLPPKAATQPAFGTPWAAVLPVALVLFTTVTMIRGAARLRRGDQRGPRDLSRSWLTGACGASLLLVLTWAWSVPVEAKAGFSLFMLPMAIAAAWGGRSAAGRLKAASESRP